MSFPRENCRIVGTPIGNLNDLSPRAVQALADADIIFAEDTRSARGLLSSLKLSKPLESYHKDNEDEAAERIIKALAEGKKTALISEAGMPGISDPGMLFIKRAIDENIPFEIIPGPCAAVSALVASGLSRDGRFLFYGFLPRKKKETVLLKLREIPYPIVFYESCHRIKQTIELLLRVFPPPVAVCRELTKIYEEALWLFNPQEIEKITPRGEFSLVVNNGGDNEPTGSKKGMDKEGVSIEMLSELLKERGLKTGEIVELLKKLGVKRNRAYKQAL
ncbi:MAG: 16S rRNA (cytidine(1402)-2'-O)-methyltransferase [Deferribacteraceae bacterium]|jgi:16S rRNA (cytidine1402-2'-O)-methyltransferase|nr:16S rRNA (cytidine(1402)-2'-O)-methyltransferase [Deferribacteraceae bacterium]